MNIHDFLFIATMIILVVILLYKLYNVFSAVEIYDIRICWLLFIGASISYGVNFVISMLDYSKLAYVILFQVSKLAFLLIVILLIVQLFMYLTLVPNKITAFKSNDKKTYKLGG